MINHSISTILEFSIFIYAYVPIIPIPTRLQREETKQQLEIFYYFHAHFCWHLLFYMHLPLLSFFCTFVCWDIWEIKRTTALFQKVQIVSGHLKCFKKTNKFSPVPKNESGKKSKKKKRSVVSFIILSVAFRLCFIFYLLNKIRRLIIKVWL